jgi:predicted RNase H-like nuclease (RuvC/YqgF family)
MSDEKKEMEDAGIGREKYWEECGVEEKIERSRVEIKNLQRIVQHLEGIIHNLTEHSHVAEKMVIPFNDHRSQGEIGLRRGRGDKEVYF